LPFSGRVHSYPQFIVRKVPKGVEQLVLCFTGGIEFPILQITALVPQALRDEVV